MAQKRTIKGLVAKLKNKITKNKKENVSFQKKITDLTRKLKDRGTLR